MGREKAGGARDGKPICTLQAADIAGLRAVVVHAKDGQARRFYEKYRFGPFPGDPLKLALLLKDLRAMVATT